MLVIVDVDPKEVDVSNDVAGDLTGDLGRLFCSFVTMSFGGDLCNFLMPSFVGDLGLLAPAGAGLLYRSWLVRIVSCGACGPPDPAWSNLFAIFLTEPTGLEGSSTGVDFAVFKVWFVGFKPLVGCCGRGERDLARGVSEAGGGGARPLGDGVRVLRPAQ